jgi:S1-C subfamily serine protease
MNKVLALILAAAMLPTFAQAARAQSLEEIFRKVSPTVVVVRSKGRDVGAGGVTRFNETGSGVLISDSGRVMTAAHVVNGMDEITVEGIAGEVVRAKLLSSNAAADIALLQLERVTAAMRVARLGRLQHGADRPTGHGHRRPLRTGLFDERGLDQRSLAGQHNFS